MDAASTLRSAACPLAIAMLAACTPALPLSGQVVSREGWSIPHCTVAVVSGAEETVLQAPRGAFAGSVEVPFYPWHRSAVISCPHRQSRSVHIPPDGQLGRIELEPTIDVLRRVDYASVPAWLIERIRGYEAASTREAPSQIWRLRHGGRRAYFVLSPCCDQYDPLWDEKGREICNPSGGFTGRGDGRCPRPVDVGTHVELVWSHPDIKPPASDAYPPLGW